MDARFLPLILILGYCFIGFVVGAVAYKRKAGELCIWAGIAWPLTVFGYVFYWVVIRMGLYLATGISKVLP